MDHDQFILDRLQILSFVSSKKKSPAESKIFCSTLTSLEDPGAANIVNFVDYVDHVRQ